MSVGALPTHSTMHSGAFTDKDNCNNVFALKGQGAVKIGIVRVTMKNQVINLNICLSFIR